MKVKGNDQGINQQLSQRINDLRKSTREEISEEKPKGKNDFVDTRPSFFRNTNNIQTKGTSETSSIEPTNPNPQVSDVQNEEYVVNVSDQARGRAIAREIVQAMEEIDQDKVNKIKSALEKGSYEIDYEKVAQKLLNEDLLNTVSGA